MRRGSPREAEGLPIVPITSEPGIPVGLSRSPHGPGACCALLPRILTHFHAFVPFLPRSAACTSLSPSWLHLSPSLPFCFLQCVSKHPLHLSFLSTLPLPMSPALCICLSQLFLCFWVSMTFHVTVFLTLPIPSLAQFLLLVLEVSSA